ncbi:MAG: OmpA family protein [Panacibacter sp.]
MQLLNENILKKIMLIFFFFNFYQLLFAQQHDIHEAIYFKTNSFKLDSKSLNALNDLIQQCSSNSISFMKIFGYTDTIGNSRYNDILSEKRTYSVYNYLRKHSTLDTTKVYMEWLGESGDGYDLHFPEAHIQNRCVDILIMFHRKQTISK